MASPLAGDSLTMALTYFDCVEYLVAASFGGPTDAEQRDIRTAVQRAYTELVWIRDWQFYQTKGRVMFNTAWNGTVTYVASTRTVTLVTGDNFPTDSDMREIRLNNVVCKVATRVSNTQLILDSVLYYPSDLTTATTASLYRSIYPLPSDFRNMDPPVNETRLSPLMYISPDMAMKIERSLAIQGPPAYWTIIPYDPTVSSSGYAIRVLGYPAASASLDFTYRRSPRAIKYSGHEVLLRQGTITAAGTTAITGSGTAFPSDIAGSYLRIGTTADIPGAESSIIPWSGEVKIASRSSTTAMVASSAQTFSGVKYLITDPIDMPPGMTNVMLSGCSYWLARIRGEKSEQAFAMYQRDLRLAMENDALFRPAAGNSVVWDPMGWRSPLKADNYVGGA